MLRPLEELCESIVKERRTKLHTSQQSFSDAPLGGSTAGVILVRNGFEVSITDVAPNPAQGVRVTVTGAGTGPVQVRLIGKTGTLELPAGQYVVTDPVSTTTLAVESGGPARVQMSLNGLPLAVVVGTASSVTFSETTGPNGTLTGLSIDAVNGSVTLNDAPLTSPLNVIGPPMTADACRSGNWQTFNFPRAFKNQGDCVSYVVTGRRNLPAGR